MTAQVSRIVVRRAEAEDIAGLADALWPDVRRAQVEYRWEEHRDGYREVLVAKLDGRVVGTVSTSGHRHQMPDSLRMLALDVGPAFRGRGVGAALVRAVEEEARRRGLAQVNLEVAVSNVNAVRLYERLGYSRLGEPVVDRWTRLADDGGSEQVEELSWVMVRPLREAKGPHPNLPPAAGGKGQAPAGRG